MENRKKITYSFFLRSLSTYTGIIGALALSSCLASKRPAGSSFSSVLLEDSSEEDLYSTMGKKNKFTKNLNRQPSIMLKFSYDNPSFQEIKLPISTYLQKSQQTALRELKLKLGLKTTVFLASVDTKIALTATTLSQKNLKITCQFTTYLNADSQVANALEAFGRPVNGSFGLRNNSSMLYTSYSFIAPPPHTPKNILAQCQERYKKDFQGENSDNLVSLANNMAYSYPRQRCDTSTQPESTQHDSQCSHWFQAREYLHDKRVVARCESILEASNNNGFCVASSLPREACPIFLDKYHRYTDKPDESISTIKTSIHKIQFLCDKTQRCKATLKNRSGLFEASCLEQ